MSGNSRNSGFASGRTAADRSAASGDGLVENFLADLDRSWQEHGVEIFDRVKVEQPRLYFRALIKLTVVLHRAASESENFDRRRNREEVLLRLEQQAKPAS